MKKSILIIALMAFTFTGFAQVKKDTIAKPKPAPKVEYRPDAAKQYTFNLTADEVQLIATNPDGWKQLEWSQSQSGEQIQQIKSSADDLRKKIMQQLQQMMYADYKKWQADTLRAGKLLKSSKIKQ